MCRAAVVAGVMAATFAAMHGAGAQRPAGPAGPSAHAERERIVDAAGVAYRAALAALVAFDDSVARQRIALDSASVGPFRLVFEPRLRGLAEPSARIASGRVGRLTDDVSALRGYRFVVRDDAAFLNLPVVSMALVDTTGVEVGQTSGRPDTITVGNWLYGQALAILGRALHPQLGNWLLAPMPFDTITVAQWSRQRIDLVSARAAIAARCWDGDLRACKITYGLQEVPDLARTWFDAAERAAIVHRYSWSFRNYNSELAVSCMRGNDDDSCARIINESGIVSQPIGQSHRVTLAQFAVQAGGQGALDRLKRTVGSPVQRLEAAAGLPIDTLIVRHLDRLRNARLPSDDISMPIVGMSLAWVLVLGALSLRSSRWR